MSSDNFWLVRRTRDHRFVPLMGFASDDARPTLDARHLGAGYETPLLALQSVSDEYAEYGASIDPECFESNAVFDARKAIEDEAVTAVFEHLSYLNQLGEPAKAEELVAIVEPILTRNLHQRVDLLEEKLRSRR
jgi:hypothetical protein